MCVSLRDSERSRGVSSHSARSPSTLAEREKEIEGEKESEGERVGEKGGALVLLLHTVIG